MSDMTLAKRVGATLAAFTVAGGLAIVGSGAAFADTPAAAPAAPTMACPGIAGDPSQPKDTTKIHMIAPSAPVDDAATMTAGTPAGDATSMFSCHLKEYHSVGLGDYAKNNADDPVGYSGGTHIDMTEDMLGQPGLFDSEQEMLGANPDPEFKENGTK